MSELKVNTISEVTGANGVVVDSVKLKDGEVYTTKIQYTDGDDAITIADGGGITVAQNATFSGTIGSGAITSTGIVTGTAFTAGSAVLAEAELELLDGLTAGTAIASKVVTTDANIDTTGQRNLTISGELDAATLDISGAIDIAGASQFNSTITVGVDDTGYDFKLFGATSGSYALWDESVNHLILAGGSEINIGGDTDAAFGPLQIGNTSDNHAYIQMLGSVAGNIHFGDATSGDAREIGSIVYRHDTDTMFLKTSGATGLQIDSAGHVTKPKQPFVYAYMDGDQTMTANDSDEKVELDAELFDVNADFNTSNNTFTAPVTGIYMVVAHWVITGDLNANITDMFFKLGASNGDEFVAVQNPQAVQVSTASAFTYLVHGSIPLQMDANDTLIMEADCFSGNGASHQYVLNGGSNARGDTTRMVIYLLG